MCEQHMIADRFGTQDITARVKRVVAFYSLLFFLFARMWSPKRASCSFFLMAFSRILLSLFFCLYAFLLFLFYFIDSVFYIGKSAIRVS